MPFSPAVWIVLAVSAASLLAAGYALAVWAQRRRRMRVEPARPVYVVTHDPLTGLPNRAAMARAATHAIAEVQRSGDGLAFLALSVDRLKPINQSLGHEAGDALLCELVRRLRAVLRRNDVLGRLAGDEFIVVAREVNAARDIETVIHKIMNALRDPVTIGERDIHLSLTIGASLFPHDGVNYELLLRRAETAMRDAKAIGRGGYRLYSAEMSTLADDRLSLESGLRRALEDGQLELHYQPKVDIETGRVRSAEALLRWRHPERGLVAPNVFIPVAEETGLIVPIGDWVLREACRQNVQWRAEGLPVVPIAVNISIRQLMAGDLAQRVQEILQEFALAPEWLQLEITESLVMANAAQAIGRLNALRQLGLRLAVDDFGTGYSSLSYLKRLPIDTIKIDKAFVRDITIDPDDATITRTIIAMAHSLKLNVVAEGVETNDQLQFLRDEGCEEMQGYWLARPLPPAEIADVLKRHW